MKKVYGYVRVSTTGQAEEGFSLDHQKNAIKEYCKLKGLKLLRIFVDDKSGRTADRDDFQKMLVTAKPKGVDKIVIFKVDRFARNLRDFTNIFEDLKKSEIELHSTCEGDLTNNSSIIPNLFASLAQWESEQISIRTKGGMMQKFKDGWQPTKPPLGYRSVGGERERKTWELDSNTAPIIKKMFELYSTGSYSIADLQEWLRDKNIISTNGTVISHSRIHNILRDPSYYGLIRWNGQSKIGKHQPLISKQLFETCQFILAKHRNFLTRRRKYNFLLNGHVYCHCGTRMVAEWHKIRSNGKKIGYYHCQKRYAPTCREPYVEISELEKQVEKYIKRIEFKQEFIDKVVKQAKEFLESGRKNTLGMKQALINQKTALEIRRNKLEDYLIDEAISKETYQRKHVEIQDKIDNLQAQIEELDQESQLDFSLIEEVLELTRDIQKTYKNAPKYLKKHYLRFFYERFVVSNKTITEAVPTPIFKALLSNNVVRLRQAQLTTSPYTLYKLFPRDLLAQFKAQLEDLKQVLASEPNYSIVEAKNGRFCQLPVPSAHQ